MSGLYYPLRIVESSFEVKGSEFIAYLVAMDCFAEFVAQMRIKHPKAVHFVTSSRKFNSQGQIEESFSDDGEPKGTSGMPTLKVLRGYDLIDCGILVVRYFGGTLLGTGGLVRAYTQATKDAVIKAKEQGALQLYVPKESLEIEIPLSVFSKAEYLMKYFEISVANKEFLATSVKLKLESKAENLQLFLNKLEF
ncbi:YigZ family protein [Helicobacter rodentium]|uniref:YigZ family protein n=1 Tax=Helicobacter rodentium TaxID=59617 RepID=UPI00047CBDBB|nr:YigZ family protein [Helicobacter rodentium]